MKAHIDGHECDAFVESVEDENEFTKLKISSVNKYFRYPATLGDSYKPSKDAPTIVMTVTALNGKITTKAGEFDCIVYTETSTEDEAYTNTSWVAPGVGIVKTQSVQNGETFTSELVSYTLADE